MRLSKTKFHKFSATENDFLVAPLLTADQVADFKSDFSNSKSDLAKKLCHRTLGLGADGLLFLEPSKEADYKWDFYNSDGSSAEMCGNAARCATLWSKLNGHERFPVRFATVAGLVSGEILLNDQVRVTMSKIARLAPEPIQMENLFVHWVDSGVPQAVIEIDVHPKPEQLSALALTIRHNDRFKPRGTNVTFFHRTSKNSISALTFERGVENFTRACGTGAVAAAFVAANETPKELTVQVPGGTLLVFTSPDKPTLTGEALWLGEFRTVI